MITFEYPFLLQSNSRVVKKTRCSRIELVPQPSLGKSLGDRVVAYRSSGIEEKVSAGTGGAWKRQRPQMWQEM